jgi:hypothetical protein
MTAALAERDPADRGSVVAVGGEPRRTGNGSSLSASTALPPSGYARLLLAWSAELERRPVTFGEFMDTRKEPK